MMKNDDPRELESVAHMKLSTFLRRGDILRECALWDLIHDECQVVDRRDAVAIVAEVERSDKRVRDVLEGWRPPTAVMLR